MDALEALRVGRFHEVVSTWSAQELVALGRSPVPQRFTNWFTGRGMTFLQLTAFVQPALARAMVKHETAPDLHTACALDMGDVVAAALGGDPQGLEKTLDGYYPIQFALGAPSALRSLLDAGDSPNRLLTKMAWFEWEDDAERLGLSAWHPIHMVALGRTGRIGLAAAELLRDYGASLTETAPPFGETALHIAAIYDRIFMIDWLIAHGIAVDSPTAPPKAEAATLFDQQPYFPFHHARKTPLMLASGEGQVAAVHALLRAGADCATQDGGGYTVLHYAAGSFWGPREDLVKILLEAGADPTVKGDGRCPADVAAEKGYDAIADLLTKAR